MEDQTVKFKDKEGLEREIEFDYEEEDTLDLSKKKIVSVDFESIVKIPEIYEIDLGSNALEVIDLSPLKGYQTLTRFSLFKNQLKKIDLSPL
ncbi:MAG: hypothetical protein ACFFE6_15165, partial [Candidatus Thorarchaeota archaeon]